MATDHLISQRAEVFGSLFLLVQHLSRRADRELAELGLTTRQWLLLAVLTKAFPGRSPSLSEAASAYGSSRQNVKQVALGLQARGYVRLVTDATDARTTRIELTSSVDEFDGPDMMRRTQAMLHDVFAPLTSAQLADLLRLTRLLLDGRGNTEATPT